MRLSKSRLPLLLFAVAGVAFGCIALNQFASRSNPKEEVDADSPDLALKWRQLSWKDEHGRIPKNALARARSEYFALAARSKMGPNDGYWSEIGPNNIPGRTRSLLIHPSQPNKMWLGSVGGGIWRTVDSGKSWLPVDDKLPFLAIGCMEMDPKDPNVMYAGTGEGYYNSDAINGGGILRTLDGGIHWELLPSTTGFGPVNRIAISPEDSKVLIAAVRDQGLFRSEDAGATWQQVAGGTGAAVVFHPTSGRLAVAATFDGNYHALFSKDGGKTWEEASGISAPGFESRIEFAYAPSNPNLVYANVATDGGKIYASTDGGRSYALRTKSGTTNSSWYNNHIWVDPTNPRMVVTTGYWVSRSTDGGETIENISDGYIQTEQVHPDVHHITASPGFNGSTNKTLFVTSDGGVFRTDDIFTASKAGGWTKVGLTARTTQFYGAAGDGKTGRVIGGTQDNGTLVLDRGNSSAWVEFGGDGGWSAIDPEDNRFLYGEYVFLLIHRSRDGGRNSEWMTNGLGDGGGPANFIAPVVMDPNSPKILYGGGTSLWRCADARADNYVWTRAKAAGSSPISAIAVAKGNSDIVWVGYNDGTVAKTSNASATTPTWTNVDAGIPNRYVTRVLVDDADPNTVYVTLGGFTNSNLWVTRDGGTTWNAINGTGSKTLPAVPIRTVVRHPDDAKWLTVGTEVGVCVSKDGGETWSAPSEGPVNVSVDELSYMHHSGKLLAATHGRGLWVFGGVGTGRLEVPTTIPAGKSVQCTVYLDNVADQKGQLVTLRSSNPTLRVPSSVTVGAGFDRAVFYATAGFASEDTSIDISATANGLTKTVSTVVTAAKLSFTPASASIEGGTVTTATFGLSADAPAGGIKVSLTSSDTGAALVPASVTIDEGTRSKTVNMSTRVVGETHTATLTAKWAGQTVANLLKVQPPRPVLLTFSPTTVIGGSATPATGTVTLSRNAPTGGVRVVLRSLNAQAATVGSVVEVAAGTKTATFSIDHHPVSEASRVVIVTSTGATDLSRPISVWPATALSLSFNPAVVKGGGAVTGTVTLDAPAGPAGIVVALATNRPDLASLPESVTVPGGSRTGTFTVTTSTTTAAANVTVTATRGYARSAKFRVNP